MTNTNEFMNDKSGIVLMEKRIREAKRKLVEGIIEERTYRTNEDFDKFLDKFKNNVPKDERDNVIVINTSGNRKHGVIIGEAYLIINTSILNTTAERGCVELESVIEKEIFENKLRKDSHIKRSFVIYKNELFTADMMPSSYEQAKKNFNLK